MEDKDIYQKALTKANKYIAVIQTIQLGVPEQQACITHKVPLQEFTKFVYGYRNENTKPNTQPNIQVSTFRDVSLEPVIDAKYPVEVLNLPKDFVECTLKPRKINTVYDLIQAVNLNKIRLAPDIKRVIGEVITVLHSGNLFTLSKLYGVDSDEVNFLYNNKIYTPSQLSQKIQSLSGVGVKSIIYRRYSDYEMGNFSGLDTTAYKTIWGIEVLHLTARPHNALKRTGILTIQDILDNKEKIQSAKIRNIGAGSLDEIRQKVNSYFGAEIL